MRGCLREFGHVTAEQGLVGGYDVLARGEGFGEDLGGGVLAADDLDDDVDARVAHHVMPVGGELLGAHA